ncbi:MAG: GNAT family N-acetyltransferase [Muribaculaceae bacterium]|nr:GNAT family N-acetyltransferase [Muribaculaceae bacterium]
METIIPAIDPQLIERELTSKRFLRTTNRAGNHIYVVDAHHAPMTMREIGRLREISFRAGGGGTGKACDIDEFDTMTPPCRQLLVWNPEAHEIVGAYRYLAGSDIRFTPDGRPRIATAHMFNFSDEFLRHYLSHTIELGRSWVQPKYQSTLAGSRAIYALDNLWDGLGALTVEHPEVEYLFGKMTMYPTYDRDCRNLLLHFLHLYFPDPDRLVTPIAPLPNTHSALGEANYFKGNDFKEDYRRLNTFVREHGINIPPLVNAYMSLSPSMRILGTAINHEFGDVEETGLLIRIADILDQKKARHIDTYSPQPKSDLA